MPTTPTIPSARLSDRYGFSQYATTGEGFFLQIHANGRIADSVACREIFHGVFTARTPRIGYRGKSTIKVGGVRRFFRLVETRLGLTERTLVQEVEVDGDIRAGVLAFTAPVWWRQTDTHRQVFTLLVRAACAHYERQGTVWQTLDRYRLVDQCKVPLARFLQGFTQPTYAKCYNLRPTIDQPYSNGFVSFFYNRPESEVNTLLVKPEGAA